MKVVFPCFFTWGLSGNPAETSAQRVKEIQIDIWVLGVSLSVLLLLLIRFLFVAVCIYCVCACLIFMQPVDPVECLYFEAKNQNLTDNTSIGMGKVPLRCESTLNYIQRKNCLTQALQVYFDGGTLHCTALCRTVLYYAVLCGAALHCIVLCCAVLSAITRGTVFLLKRETTPRSCYAQENCRRCVPLNAYLSFLMSSWWCWCWSPLPLPFSSPMSPSFFS